jgi:hypothetical protein
VAHLPFAPSMTARKQALTIQPVAYSGFQGPHQLSEVFTKDYPAWTAIGVSALAMPGLLVEIKATAVL